MILGQPSDSGIRTFRSQVTVAHPGEYSLPQAREVKINPRSFLEYQYQFSFNIHSGVPNSIVMEISVTALHIP